MQFHSHEPTSHHVVVRQLESRYDALIASGQKHAFVYPFMTYGAFFVMIYLCINHRRRPRLRQCRFLVWGVIACFSTWCLLHTRARNPAAAFLVGLINSWGTLWCAVMLVFNDAQKDFQRIERKEIPNTPSFKVEGKSQSNGHLEEKEVHASGNGEVRNRISKADSGNGLDASTELSTGSESALIWQSYPTTSFTERLDWVCDLFSSFRGMGWNFRISGLPPPPSQFQHELGAKGSINDTRVSRTGVRRYQNKRQVLRHNAYLLCRNYLILDVLKTLMVNDPFFWTGSYSQRPGYLPAFLDAYTVIDRSSRLLISLAAIYYALEAIFCLGPLFFVGILGDRLLGVRGEAWLYTDQFGSFSNVLDQGLAGWWSGWWHQTFRLGFEMPANRLVELLGCDRKSAVAKFLRLCVAFTLSGLLHASGSYTQLGDTRPLRPFAFFFLQILGVAGQAWTTVLLARMGVRDACPKPLRRAANFVYVFVFLYHTAPLLIDDFAKGGVWLFEPLPVSFLRGLGLGASEDGWFPLAGGNILRWHSGSSWWNTGLAF